MALGRGSEELGVFLESTKRHQIYRADVKYAVRCNADIEVTWLKNQALHPRMRIDGNGRVFRCCKDGTELLKSVNFPKK